MEEVMIVYAGHDARSLGADRYAAARNGGMSGEGKRSWRAHRVYSIVLVDAGTEVVSA